MPSTPPAEVVSSPSPRAMPKSQRYACRSPPGSVRRSTFADLRSRWTIPWECASSRAAATCATTSAARRGERPALLETAAQVSVGDQLGDEVGAAVVLTSSRM